MLPEKSWCQQIRSSPSFGASDACTKLNCNRKTVALIVPINLLDKGLERCLDLPVLCIGSLWPSTSYNCLECHFRLCIYLEKQHWKQTNQNFTYVNFLICSVKNVKFSLCRRQRAGSFWCNSRRKVWLRSLEGVLTPPLVSWRWLAISLCSHTSIHHMDWVCRTDTEWETKYAHTLASREGHLCKCGCGLWYGRALTPISRVVGW